MSFPENLGVISCDCVISGGKPVLAVSHAGGDWQMYCSWSGHDFASTDIAQELKLVGIGHLLARDPGLALLADLPVDRGAERVSLTQSWVFFDDSDDQ